MWQIIWNAILQALKPKPLPPAPPAPAQQPETPDGMDDESKFGYQPPAYLWDTKEHIRHSIRTICDEKFLTVEQKNTMTATIYGESEFNLHVVCLNLSNGEAKSSTVEKMDDAISDLRMHGIFVKSTDYGLCQWNDYYHGKEISPEQAVNNPEKAVRLMADYWKRGQRDLWIAYKGGRYKQFLTLVQNPM